MKWIFQLLLLLAIGLAFWMWNKPGAPARRLAPRGVFYLVDYVSLQTPRGVIGFEPGQEVRFVSATSTTLKVTDGKYQVDLTPVQLTDDLDIAALVRQRDIESQRQLAAYQAAELAAYERNQLAFNLQHSNHVDAANYEIQVSSKVGGRVSKLDDSSRWVRGYASRGYYGGVYNYLQSPNGKTGANGYNVNDWNR